MTNPASAAPVGTTPDPQQDHPAGTLPRNIARILRVIGVLHGYGQHLLDTIGQRALSPGFNAIAVCFGTTNLSTIILHIRRGLMLYDALQRFVLEHAATGRDLEGGERLVRAPDTQPVPARPPAAPRAPAAPQWGGHPLMPSMEDIERAVRRYPIGRIITAICLDLGVFPAFCLTAFWNDLFEVIDQHGGSLAELMQCKADRHEALAKELDRRPGSDWGWLDLTWQVIRQTLGFFIGEPPVNPFATATAEATGPP